MAKQKKTDEVAEKIESAPQVKPDPQITVYNFHEITKEYLGEGIARLDPEEKEPTYLIPRNATDIAPPQAGEKESAVFNVETNEWEVLADHRGEEYFKPDGTHVLISTIGETKPDDAFTTRPETWDSIRYKRDGLLKDSDWTQLGDAPLDDAGRAAWAEYRQALRDVTNADKPSKVVWPAKPE